MSKSKFHKLIKCGLCGSNMVSKKERNKNKYICYNYKKNSESCRRIPVEENILTELLERRFHRILTKEEIRENVQHVEVFDKIKGKDVDIYKLTIYLHDQDPIILDDTYWQF